MKTDDKPLVWRPTGERLVCSEYGEHWSVQGLPVTVRLVGMSCGKYRASTVRDATFGPDPQAALDALADRLREQHAALGKVLGVRSAEEERAAVVAQVREALAYRVKNAKFWEVHSNTNRGLLREVRLQVDELVRDVEERLIAIERGDHGGEVDNG